MEARIDWGDWSLLAMALMMGQHADDVSGMANITPLWPAILHRLMHPCNIDKIYTMGHMMTLRLSLFREYSSCSPNRI